MSETDAYRALYVAESREYHEKIVKNLLLLEKGTDHGAIDEIFRAAHSLKGMSASMGFLGMERLCHAMEDVFSVVRSGKAEFDQSLGDLLLAVTDEIEAMLDAIEAGDEDSTPDLEAKISALSEWRRGGAVGSPSEAGERSSGPVAPAENAVEGSADYHIKIRMDSSCDNANLRGMLLLQNIGSLGEIVSCVPPESVIEDGVFEGSIELGLRTDAGEEAVRAASQVTGVKELEIIRRDGIEEPERETPGTGTVRNEEHEVKEGILPEGKGREVKNIRVDISRLDQMMNLVEDLVINRGRIQQIARKNQLKELEETLNMVGRSVSDLQNLMMNIRMIPLTHIFNRFPRVVRDIARREEKDVELSIEGGDVELDRSVMEGLNDPLLHLIRNAIDHGIEHPAQRISAGKLGTGHLRIAARRESENVIILIEDDGRGIDVHRVQTKAIERGVIT
ncbi:MAG: Hpt domain-containing protein, partial [Methanoregulaceae archaeon]|nr:Hpt domain-containing protein [Methanoregulaceae archaeon]